MLCDRFIRKFGRLGPEGQPTEILLNDVVQQVAPLPASGHWLPLSPSAKQHKSMQQQKLWA